ncbi:transcription factor bHLH91-like protein [Tanacetum coccineum]
MQEDRANANEIQYSKEDLIRRINRPTPWAERLFLVAAVFTHLYSTSSHLGFCDSKCAVRCSKAALLKLHGILSTMGMRRLQTSLCLQFKAHQIAPRAIFLATKFLRVKLPPEQDLMVLDAEVVAGEVEGVGEVAMAATEACRRIQEMTISRNFGSRRHMEKRGLLSVGYGVNVDGSSLMIILKAANGASNMFSVQNVITDHLIVYKFFLAAIKTDCTTVVGEAITYINELKGTVEELKHLVDRRRCNGVVGDTTHDQQAYNGNSSSTMRSSMAQRKSKHTETDVQRGCPSANPAVMPSDEETFNIITKKRKNDTQRSERGCPSANPAVMPSDEVLKKAVRILAGLLM